MIGSKAFLRAGPDSFLKGVVMAETYPHPKMNFRQWVANFWYHYRWQFIFSVIAASFILIAAFQFVFRIMPDASFLYVGSFSPGENTCKALVASAEERFAEDYNGDGKTHADIRTIVLSDDLDLLNRREQIEANKAFQRYSQEILAGDDCFLLLSPYFYDELEASGALVSLYEIYGFWPEIASYHCGFRLKDTPLGKTGGFSDLPDDTMICLKYAGAVGGDMSFDQREEANALNARIFRDLCSGTV